MNLQKLGFDDWFQHQFKAKESEQFSVARVLQVNKNSYLIGNGKDEINAELTGKFLFGSESDIDLPTVGDWVVIQYFDDNSMGIIHDVLPRKSVLKRKSIRKSIGFQLLAANIDFAMIVQGADFDFNLNRLERYLIMIHESNIDPILLISKCDLVTDKQLSEITKSIKNSKHNIEYILFSNVTGMGMETIKKMLLPYKTYCLLGSSGVGKTTLLNNLLGEEFLKVNPVREKDKRGRHTTTHRNLILLDNESIFIDTPGLRELANFDVEKGLEETFEEFYELATDCRFSDCSHTHEKECAVLNAVENGTILKERYDNFIKLQKETRFHQMSYLEKRRRDKEFGKIVKQIMKNKKRK